MGRAGFIAARPRDDVLTVPGVLNANLRWPDEPADDGTGSPPATRRASLLDPRHPVSTAREN
jgi:hypothetical protein